MIDFQKFSIFASFSFTIFKTNPINPIVSIILARLLISENSVFSIHIANVIKLSKNQQHNQIANIISQITKNFQAFFSVRTKFQARLRNLLKHQSHKVSFVNSVGVIFFIKL